MLLLNMIGDEDVTLEEIVEACSFIINNMIENLDKFDDAVEECKKEYLLDSNVVDFEDFNNYSSDVRHFQKDFLEKISSHVWSNANYLDKINQEIEQQKALENTAAELNKKNEKELETIKAKLANTSWKKKKLQETSDAIQLCKILTNTSFIYKITNISGYVIDHILKNVMCFEWKPEELSQVEITNRLYDMLKKISSEDNVKLLYKII